jgi:DNA-binding beta-propeller fold protein YncE/mono/diheme cytochrome c family protein
MGFRETALPASFLCLAALTFGVTASEAEGKRMLEPHFDDQIAQFGHFEGFGFGFGFPNFQLEDAPLGTNKAPGLAPHAGSHGGTIAADSHGLLVLDRDTGKLVRTDKNFKQLASLTFGSWAGELVRDGTSEFAYVADRTAHRVVRVRAGATTLELVDTAKIREPHGLALSPDGKTLYVTSVADHQLVAFDTETMHVRWKLDLAAEPRGVAVSASGKRAIVGFLSTGALASVELGTTLSQTNVHYIGLDPAQRVVDPFTGEVFVDAAFSANGRPGGPTGGTPSVADTKDIGLRFARNVYAVGFIGDDVAIAPHQLSAPHLPSSGGEDMETYGGGGGFTAPITHRGAMIDAEDSFAPKTAFAQIGLHQPRALAYDAASDTLYLAGYGNDQLMAIAEASQSTIHMSWSMALPSNRGCAPDGIAVAGDQLFVHCELDRNVVRLELSTVAQFGTPSSSVGAALGPSTRSEAAQRGAELFRRGQDPRVSLGGVMACASCHAEGRTDGLSWRIEGHNLQTPLLAGRVMGTHPFKWDGKDKDLPTSLTNTVGRLGGTGLSPTEVADLQAFLESLPQPIAPTVTNAEVIARGKVLFESEQTACAACHSGPGLADGIQHDLATNIGKVDTPSLIGLAHTAPYYHDGSARTLRALLTDKGSIHDMGSTAHLSEAELGDLIAYLESL